MKKLFLTFILLTVSLLTFAFDRYLVSGGTGDWNSTTNWSNIDGGGSGSSFPVAGDNVYFTTLSANAPITVNVASACATLIASGTYAGQLTINAGLTVSGTFTLIAAMPNVAGTSTITFNTTATLTSGGNTITGGVTFAGTSQTYTLADDWDIDGTVTINSATSGVFNGQTIYAGAGLTTGTGTSTLTGTTAIVMDGTGSLTTSVSTKVLSLNLTINTAGTITIGTFRYGAGTLTYTAGTVITAGGSFAVVGTGTILNVSGINWNTVLLNNSGTNTLLSDLNISSTLTYGSGAINTIMNGLFNINANGSVTSTITTGSVTGTATLRMIGTGTLSMASVTTGYLSNNLTFNAGANTITISGTINYRTGTITNTSGLFVVAGSTLAITGDVSLNLADMTLNNLSVTNNNTDVTLSSGLIIAGAFTNSGIGQTIVSSVPATQRVLTMLSGSTNTLTDLDATDIDSDAGLPVVSTGATLSNTLNWYSAASDLTNFFLMW